METVTVHQAKTQLSRLLAEVEAGREIVIARGTTPVAKLVALTQPVRRQPGALKGIIHLDESFWDELDDETLGYGPDANLDPPA